MNDLRVNDLFSMEPFDDVFRGMMRPWKGREMAQRAPQIRLDLSETDAQYTVKAEIPGVKKGRHRRPDRRQPGDDRRQEGRARKGRTVACCARSASTASRSFTPPSAVDESRSTAKYQDGVLELTLPKTTTRRPSVFRSPEIPGRIGRLPRGVNRRRGVVRRSYQTRHSASRPRTTRRPASGPALGVTIVVPATRRVTGPRRRRRPTRARARADGRAGVREQRRSCQSALRAAPAVAASPPGLNWRGAIFGRVPASARERYCGRRRAATRRRQRPDWCRRVAAPELPPRVEQAASAMRRSRRRVASPIPAGVRAGRRAPRVRCLQRAHCAGLGTGAAPTAARPRDRKQALPRRSRRAAAEVASSGRATGVRRWPRQCRLPMAAASRPASPRRRRSARTLRSSAASVSAARS